MVNDKKQAQNEDEVLHNEEVKNEQIENPIMDEDKEENTSHDDKKAAKKKGGKKEDPAKKEIEELTAKYNDINDKYIRLSAEFDNYRKRTLKEKTDLIKTAGGDTLSSMLPVVDDFERALQSIENATDVVAVKEGVALIYNKFKEFLKNKGIAEIDALNQEFNTDFHEALTKIPAPEESMKGKVVDVIQKGYKIEDKVIRFAKVVIGE